MTTVPDRQLADALFYLDVRIAEHYEVDAVFGDPDGPSPQVQGDFDARRQIRAEVDRRTEFGIQIDDPDEPSFEERHAPYGIEWQIEQRERAEGR